MNSDKIEKLRGLARDSAMLHRILTMYDIGEYNSIEDCLYDAVVALAMLNEQQRQSLIEMSSLQPFPSFLINKENYIPE